MNKLSLLTLMFSTIVFAGDGILNTKTIDDSSLDLDTASYCRQAFEADTNSVEIKSTNISNDKDNIYIEINTVGNVFDGNSYKEYYAWIDTDPKSKKGYVPYFQEPSVDLDNLSTFRIGQYQAWENFYADHRIFVSNTGSYQNSDQVLFKYQNCKEYNCSNLNAAKNAKDKNMKYDINKKSIMFKIPIATLNLNSEQDIEVGITTYYENSAYGTCSGEDDVPNWGKKAIQYKVIL